MATETEEIKKIPLCSKCGAKEILMQGNVYARPDAEPYESGVEEEIDILDCEFGIVFTYCPDCEKPNNESFSSI